MRRLMRASFIDFEYARPKVENRKVPRGGNVAVGKHMLERSRRSAPATCTPTSNRRLNMYGGQLRYDLANEWDGEEDHEDIETDEEVDDE